MIFVKRTGTVRICYCTLSNFMCTTISQHKQCLCNQSTYHGNSKQLLLKQLADFLQKKIYAE